MGLAKRKDVFEGLAVHAAVEALLSIDGRAAEWIQIESVSHKYFDVLQLNAVRGRAFLPGKPAVPAMHRSWSWPITLGGRGSAGIRLSSDRSSALGRRT